MRQAAPDSIPEPAETSAPAAGAEAAAAPDADGEEAFLGGGKKGKKKKGGKKALADMDSAFAALDVGEQQPSGQPAEPPGANEDADEPLFLGVHVWPATPLQVTFHNLLLTAGARRMSLQTPSIRQGTLW